MHRLRQYDNPIQARQAAMWMIRHGIPATVVGDYVSSLGPYVGLTSRHGMGSFTLSIALKRQRDEAEELLSILDSEPAEYESGWEDQSVPDLSGLDPSLLPACPGCGEILPADASTENCPVCRADVDVLGMITSEHGPEVIEPLLAESDNCDDWITDELLELLAADCSGCGYPLDGLPHAGGCPECGTAYDKRAILESLTRDLPPEMG